MKENKTQKYSTMNMFLSESCFIASLYRRREVLSLPMRSFDEPKIICCIYRFFDYLLVGLENSFYIKQLWNWIS